jgi:hypothetical protein
MKTLLKICGLAIVLLGIETSSFAQLTISPDASGTIVQTITFTKTADLDFGNMAVTTVAGTCILDPQGPGVPNRSITGGVTLPGFIGTPLAAAFTVTGTAGENITITILQNGINIIHTNGTDFMLVDTYTCSSLDPIAPDEWRMVLDALNGDATFYVGATCHVAANQLAGFYTLPAAFPVTVNYE